jgi:hypothetical protein
MQNTAIAEGEMRQRHRVDLCLSLSISLNNLIFYPNMLNVKQAPLLWKSFQQKA